MTEAQKEALGLLRLVNDVCENNNLTYTLISTSLINYEFHLEQEYFAPNDLGVGLLYSDFEKLICELERKRDIFDIEIITFANKDNFDSLSAWLMHKGKNLLPKDREEDECYYKTRIAITPMFYAGDSFTECTKTCKKIKTVFKYIDCRMPLPKKRLFSPLKGKIARTKQRYYCYTKNRYNYSVEKIMDELKSKKESLFIVYKNIANSTAWMTMEEYAVEKILYYGTSTYAIKNRRDFLERNYQNKLKNGFDKVSELKLRGGRDLRRIQLIQLDMLKEVDRVCRKYNLKYNIAFGTLLGAVRHGGFIPWDDDADINMPYEDYLKFIDVIDNELDQEKYYFRYQDKESDCNITYAHLKRNGTIYTKRNRERFKYHPGVFIDIVPLFNGAPNFLFHSIQTRICWFYRTACWAYVGAGSEKGKIKRAYYKSIAKIGNKAAYRRFIKAATFFKHKRNKMLFLNGLDRSPYNVGFVKRECFDDSVEIEFEGYKFFAPRDQKGVLDYCYGKDHMKYLPVVKRVPKNDALIELGNLYADI